MLRKLIFVAKKHPKNLENINQALLTAHPALRSKRVLVIDDEADFAHSFREIFQARGYSFRLPPTAVLELHENWHCSPVPRKRELSRMALLNLRLWGVRTFELTPVQHAIAERFLHKLAQTRLLPEEEVHDARILVETSLAQIPLLVSGPFWNRTYCIPAISFLTGLLAMSFKVTGLVQRNASRT